MTGKKLKPNEEIRAKRIILTSMEPVVIEMTNLSASQKEEEGAHRRRAKRRGLIYPSIYFLQAPDLFFCFGVMCIHIKACITDRDLTYH
jgi:hypothetical protein